MRRDEIAENKPLTEIEWEINRTLVALLYSMITRGQALHNILSTLTKDFEVVEECDSGFIVKDDPFKEGYVKVHITCLKCHGTGTITRQATWEEIMEALKFFLAPKEDDWIIDRKKFNILGGYWHYILKSGGRLRGKK